MLCPSRSITAPRNSGLGQECTLRKPCSELDFAAIRCKLYSGFHILASRGSACTYCLFIGLQVLWIGPSYPRHKDFKAPSRNSYLLSGQLSAECPSQTPLAYSAMGLVLLCTLRSDNGPQFQSLTACFIRDFPLHTSCFFQILQYWIISLARIESTIEQDWSCQKLHFKLQYPPPPSRLPEIFRVATHILRFIHSPLIALSSAYTIVTGSFHLSKSNWITSVQSQILSCSNM